LTIDRSSFDSWFDAQESFDKSILGKVADIYDGMPSVIKALKNFEPLGIAGSVADVLADIKAERKEKQLREVLYNYCLAIYEILQKINNLEIDIDRIKPQVPALSDVYLDTGMRSYQIEKIEYLKNILVNGVIDYNRELDEKISMFSLLASLTISQIRAVIFVNGNYRIMKVEEIAQELSVENAYARQLCMSLNGMGLLNITDIGGLGQGSGGYEFGPTEYGREFVAYILGS
jgi:sulfur carrier protein ThiS